MKFSCLTHQQLCLCQRSELWASGLNVHGLQYDTFVHVMFIRWHSKGGQWLLRLVTQLAMSWGWIVVLLEQLHPSL